MEKKISSIAYFIIFGLVIVMMGIMSFRNLMKFYVNDEVDYNEWTVDLGSKFETDVATTFFKKFQFVNVNGAIRNILGQREMHGVVKLNNGYLHSPIAYVDDTTLQGYADNLSDFNFYLKERGTDLVFAVPPYTSGKYDPQLPEGIVDYGNDDVDRLVEYIHLTGVDIIDFRETMYEDGINHYDMMYRTDHHWNTAAGFYAYEYLEDYIINATDCKVDKRVSNLDNYTIKTYREWHLGSRGRMTGRYFAGIDDFNLYIPNFDTTIQNEEGVVGSMQDIVINMEPLSDKNYLTRYTYDSVLGDSLGHYVNLDCDNDIKILFITDSFGKAVAPYLMMGFSELLFVYEGDLFTITPDYIESYDPDVVIMLYYITGAMMEDRYNFQGF